MSQGSCNTFLEKYGSTKSHIHMQEQTTNHCHNLVLAGKKVCCKAWWLAHNSSHFRLDKCVRLFKAGIRQVSHSNRGRKKMGWLANKALQWMKFTFPHTGDFMPHKTQSISNTYKSYWNNMQAAKFQDLYA